MKRTFIFFLLCHLYMAAFAQDRIFVRHDTTLLKAEECEWLVKSSAFPGQLVSAIILDAIAAGKLKAVDSQTGEMIPGDKIYTWRQSTDTTMVWDEKKQDNVIKLIRHTVNPESISRIRICHDWYLDPASGKIQSLLRSRELLIEVRSYDGSLRGYQSFCRLE